MLSKLRSKPEIIRAQYALTATIAIMVVVVGVWVWSLGNRFTSRPTQAHSSAPSPVSLLGSALTGFKQSIGDISGQVKETFGAFSNKTQTK